MLVGLARPSFSLNDKLNLMQRAVQLLHDHMPHAPVVFADGYDTLWVGPLDSETPAMKRLNQVTMAGHVMFGAECMSYPRCYIKEPRLNFRASGVLWTNPNITRDLYENNTSHQRCKTRSKTCFPNSGLYGGSSAAMLQMLPKAFQIANEITGIEHNNDQAGVNRLIASNSLNTTLIDEDSEVFLDLHACRGSDASNKLVVRGPEYRNEKVYYKELIPDRKGRQTTICFYTEWDPMRRIGLSGNTSSVGLWKQRALTGKAHAKHSRPLLVHANGNFKFRGGWVYDLWKKRTPLIEDSQRPAAIINHPVLVLDVRQNGRLSCKVISIGDVLKKSR